MCGIYGSVNANRNILIKMAEFDSSRGPDALNINSCKNIHFAHNLLHFSGDISNALQPIKDGNNLFSFAGEIYNYKDLALSLGIPFNDNLSDTAVIYEGIKKFGIDFVDRLDGMFAIAFYESKKNKLHLARDKYGTKPLFYSLFKQSVFFSSSLPAFRFTPLKFDLNIENLFFYNNFGFYFNDESPLQNIHKVAAGSIVSIDLTNKEITKTYISEKNSSNESEIVNDILSTYTINKDFDNSGILLSGGLDSSLILAILIKNSLKIRPYISIESNNIGDDNKYAFDLCKKLNIEPKVIEFNENIFNNRFQSSYKKINEPRYNPSFVFYDYVISQTKKDGTRMLISGDGADEIFAGYPKYQNFLKSHHKKNSYKLFYETTCFKKMEADLPYIRNQKDLFNYVLFTQKVNKLPAHRNISNHSELQTQLSLERTIGWLANEALPRGDTIGSKYSIELRYPYMRKNIINQAKNLPIDNLISKNDSKIYLKSIAKAFLPKKIIRQPKRGWNFNYWENYKSKKIHMRDWMMDNSKKYQDYANIPLIIERGCHRSIFSWFNLMLWAETNSW